jgi:hypothetical protein
MEPFQPTSHLFDPTRVRTMIACSNSPTIWGGRMPNQEAGLSHDHGICRAVLHANPGSAARSPLASAASSTTSPPASVPCHFPKVPDRGRFANREIRIELSRSVGNALTSIPVTQRAVGPDCRCTTDCRLINPIMQTRLGGAGGHKLFVGRPRAKCDRGGCGKTIDGTPVAVSQRHR